jgi:hypothetical protein
MTLKNTSRELQSAKRKIVESPKLLKRTDVDIFCAHISNPRIKFHFNIILASSLTSLYFSCTKFIEWNSVGISLLPDACHVCLPLYPAWFGYLSGMWWRREVVIPQYSVICYLSVWSLDILLSNMFPNKLNLCSPRNMRGTTFRSIWNNGLIHCFINSHFSDFRQQVDKQIPSKRLAAFSE